MNVRFLVDETMPPRLITGVQRLEPTIDIIRVGDEGAPPLGILDPHILMFLQDAQRCLITENRVSMPGHVIDHAHQGGSHWGVFRVRPRTTLWRLADELHLILSTSQAEEWIDTFLWVSF